jgi:hypothetical protein
MNGACRNVALTCGYAVFANDITKPPYTTEGGVDEKQLIGAVSEMFYQSLLCPENSMYVGNAEGSGADVNAACKCNNGYEAWSGYCLPVCGQHAIRVTTTGKCTCETGYSGDGYTCTSTASTTQTTETTGD